MSMSTVVRLGSSLRTRLPEETLNIAEQYMAEFGISRVTQITRMDRLGLPVFTSVRPRSLTLRVNAGKGVTEIDAKVGALMEALEFAIAEPDATHWQMKCLSVREIIAGFPAGMQLVDFIPLAGVKASLDDQVPTVACETIGNGQAIWLPAQLVFMPFFPKNGPNLFGTSTNGLASGNSIDEATLHGMLEILERDAISMNRPQDRSEWVDPASFPEPFLGLSQQWLQTGVELMVRHVPNEFGLPCFHAILHESESSNVNISAGYGLHLDADIALSRAICEAAQSRLSHIHGGRDDITDFYTKYQDWRPLFRKEHESSLLASFCNRERTVHFPMLRKPVPAGSVTQHLSRLIARLAERGFHHVCRHVFSTNMHDLAVVKVIIPQCEFIESNMQRIGPRLMKAIVSHG